VEAPDRGSGAQRRRHEVNRLGVGFATVGVLLGGSGPAPGRAPSPLEPRLLPDTLWVGRASTPLSLDSLFSDWSPLAFGGDRGETSYEGAVVEGHQCLRAEAVAGGSGLLKLIQAEPDSLPRIRWSWWVAGPVPGGDLSRKEGDDFSARLYVNFRFEPSKAGLMHRLRQRLANGRFGGEAPGKALVYVWGNQAPVGSVAKSAYTDQAALVVVRSGEEGAGRWWVEERNILEDYLEAFGEEPPEFHSLAIMTDADDTGSSASACYGDILLLSPKGPPPTPSGTP
jgi:hypothetical protein